MATTTTKLSRATDFVSITFEGNYFNTREQIARRSIQYYTDASEAQAVVDNAGNTIGYSGLFSRKAPERDDVVYNSPVHATSSTVVDLSGNPRVYLSPRIDYYASGTIETYRNGVEIMREKQWIAGLAKISAGTPGHLVETNRFGISETSVIDVDRYVEVDTFDPVLYVKTGGDPAYFTYPVITSDSNQLENFVLNGTIEPFAIRSVISHFSTYFPFEPHGTRGTWMSGNEALQMSSDSVVNITEFEPDRRNRAWHLDAAGVAVVTGSTDFSIASIPEYVNTDQNYTRPFRDEVLPRDMPRSNTYDDELWAVLNRSFMSGTSPTYIEYGKMTGGTGFMYNSVMPGTDSIAFGERLY